MENASKALLMAGGILIALLIIGALVLMFNQIGDYEKGQQSNEKNSQLAQFNLDFERYMDDKGITGADIISLINKVNDYNNKANNGGVNNSVDYSIKMSITISGLDSFNEQYAYSDEKNKIFEKPLYEINYKSSTQTNILKNMLNKCEEIEKLGIPKEDLKQLSGMYDNDDIKGSEEKIKEKLKQIDNKQYSNWDKNDTTLPLDIIIKYRQYWEFKTSKFKPVGNATYQNGQIQSMTFEFYK